jgi:hypothetical protein
VINEWPVFEASVRSCSRPTLCRGCTRGPGGAVRGPFRTERAALKTLYLVGRGLDPKGTGQARWAVRRKPGLNACAVTFAHRMLAPDNL